MASAQFKVPSRELSLSPWIYLKTFQVSFGFVNRIPLPHYTLTRFLLVISLRELCARGNVNPAKGDTVPRSPNPQERAQHAADSSDICFRGGSGQLPEFSRWFLCCCFLHWVFLRV